MGANTTQAAAITAFLAGLTVLCGGLAGGGILLVLIGLVLVAVSCGLFLKAKPWEQAE